MSQPGRKRLTRAALESNGIIFHEELGQKSGPAHVESLRTTLRDTNCSIAQRLAIYDEPDLNDGSDLNSLLVKLAYAEHMRARQVLERLRTTKAKAISLHKGRDREREWVSFFANHFFSPLAQQMEITDEDSRRYFWPFLGVGKTISLTCV